MIGFKVGLLTVTGTAISTRKPRFLCACNCGNTITMTESELRFGWKKSCGCWTKSRSLKTPEYLAWCSMKSRCSNPEETRYSGRGIKVCERWKIFENFLSDMGPRPKSKRQGFKRSEYQINRIDNDGDYEPDNCEWTTCKENSRNRSNNTRITINGEAKLTTEWAEYFNISSGTMKSRVRRMKDGTYQKINTGKFKSGFDPRRIRKSKRTS